MRVGSNLPRMMGLQSAVDAITLKTGVDSSLEVAGGGRESDADSWRARAWGILLQIEVRDFSLQGQINSSLEVAGGRSGTHAGDCALFFDQSNQIGVRTHEDGWRALRNNYFAEL